MLEAASAENVVARKNNSDYQQEREGEKNLGKVCWPRTWSTNPEDSIKKRNGVGIWRNDEKVDGGNLLETGTLVGPTRSFVAANGSPKKDARYQGTRSRSYVFSWLELGGRERDEKLEDPYARIS